MVLSPTEPAAAEPEPEPEQQTENTSREVPAINIDETPVEEVETSPNRRAGNAPPSPARGVKTKPVCEIPEQGIQKKGYVHRKKGTFGGWERVYAVVTYAAIYFTSGEDVREYNHVCMLSGSGTVKVEKKGHDKQSEGLFVKSGKNKETLSLPSSEVSSWKQVMEDVLGMSQSLELGSEDEDEGAESATPTPGGAARVEDGETTVLCIYIAGITEPLTIVPVLTPCNCNCKYVIPTHAHTISFLLHTHTHTHTKG